MNITYDMLDYGGSKVNDPYRIIVHSMGEKIDNNGKEYSAVEWLKFLKLSAHALVHPNGDITVCRHDRQRASHAKGFNTDSLGIEFLVPGVHDYGTFLEAIKHDCWTQAQYDNGIEFVQGWVNEFDIKMILRHSDVSPGRKVDPGAGFRWQEFKEQVVNP